LDNITHSLAGWALGQAGLKTASRKGLAALILAANMPDIDVFFGNFPWDPLAIHRGFTHGLVGGVLLMPPLLAGLLWLLDRWQVSREATFKSGLQMHFGRLVAVCYIGALSHPLLDLLTTYSVQLFSPLSSAWYHADALFIIDLWLWLLLGLTIYWSKRREKRGGDWRRPMRAALAVVLLYISANLMISERAFAAVRGATGGQATKIFASAPPLAFWRRNLVWREGDCYRRSGFGLAGISPMSSCEPDNLDHPAFRAAVRTDSRLVKFLRWSVMPQAAVKPERCALRVIVGDARYGSGASSRLSHVTLLPASGPHCPPR
jgi:inner membrane protein